MGLLGRRFKPHIHHNKLFQIFPMSNLKNTLPAVYPGNETAWVIDRSARISGRPAVPPFQGGSVIRLSLGKLLVNLLQVAKRTNTPRLRSL